MKVLQILILIFGLFFAVHSQNTTGKSVETILSGTVYDDTGAFISNAEIKIVGSDKKEFVTRTNADGIFEIRLFPGNYLIQVESPGFQVFKLEKYKIVPSYKGKMNSDIVMEFADLEPCGAGADCLPLGHISVDESEIKISDIVLQKPLEKP